MILIQAIKLDSHFKKIAKCSVNVNAHHSNEENKNLSYLCD